MPLSQYLPWNQTNTQTAQQQQQSPPPPPPPQEQRQQITAPTTNSEPHGRRETCLGNQPPKSRTQSIRRTYLTETRIILQGHPSKGGIIILDWATAVDFTFLHLDPLNPPLYRSSSQPEEDLFCQNLLRLGARWFDSEERGMFVRLVEESYEPETDRLERGEVEEPTYRERRWVKVAWSESSVDDNNSSLGSNQGEAETTAKKGMWVSEFDNGMNYGEIKWEKERVPDDLAARVMLTRTMEERCTILRKYGNAKWFARIEDYDGFGFLNDWEKRTVVG